MKTIVRAGAVLGISCVIWTFVMGFSGWYRDPSLLNLFWIVIPIEIAVLVWGLRGTAAEGRRYWGQVGAGTMMALIGGILVFAGSFAFTAFAFPDYFQELQSIQAETLRARGMSETEIEASIAIGASLQTPIVNALTGFLGTVVTGFLASLATSAFVRAK